jgi:hypothetical protein
MLKLTAIMLGLFVACAAHAQTWQTDPANGAQRNVYGPGGHVDATGRTYYDAIQGGGMVLEPVRPNAYGLGVGSDPTARPVVPTYTNPFLETR